MITTVDKIHRLEKYLLSSKSTIDNVITYTITKLVNREFKRMKELLSRLQNQLDIFENKYS